MHDIRRICVEIMSYRFLTACALLFSIEFHLVPAIAQKEEDGKGKENEGLIEDAVLFTQIDLNSAGLEGVRACVEKGDFAAAKEAYLDYRRRRSPAKWELPAASAKKGLQEDPQAEEICRHLIRNTEFPFSPAIPEAFMGEEFDWTFNPVAESDPAFTKEWTWCVISRMGFWNNLAEGYRKTGNEKYAQKWIWFLHDFAKDHPYAGGEPGPKTELLWRGIDSGIRMNSGWPNAYFTFLESPSFTAEDHWLFLKLVYAHALRLWQALEQHPNRTGNHVNIESRGLYNIGVLFPEFREAGKWRQVATDRQFSEYRISVTPEGMQSELSPSYHFVALGTYRRLLSLASSNGLPVPEELRQKILDMYRAPVMVMDQSGRVVCTNDSTPVNAREMAKKGLAIGDDPILSWAASNGRQGKPLPDSTALEYAGFYAMRGGWAPNDIFLFFRGGPVGASGHSENDMLQVVLKAWGRTLLTEPGKYPYDKSDWRRYAINSASHNTIVVDGKWQNRRKTKLPIDQPAGNPWVTTPLFDFVSATYDQGYQQNAYSPKQFRPEKWVGDRDTTVSHTRRVLFLRPYYALILDTLDGTGKHVFDAHFHLNAPRAILDPKTQAAFSERTDNVQIGLFPLDRNDLKTEIVQGQDTPLLGWAWNDPDAKDGHRAGESDKPWPIPTVRFRKESEAPATFATFVYPYQGNPPQVLAEPLKLSSSDGAWRGFSIRTDKELLETAIAGKGDAAHKIAFASRLAGQIEVNAAGLVIRKAAAAKEPVLGAWEIDFCRADSLQFSTSRPVAVNFHFNKSSQTLTIVNKSPHPVEISMSSPFSKRVTLAPEIATVISRQFASEQANEEFLKPFEEK